MNFTNPRRELYIYIIYPPATRYFVHDSPSAFTHALKVDDDCYVHARQLERALAFAKTKTVEVRVDKKRNKIGVNPDMILLGRMWTKAKTLRPEAVLRDKGTTAKEVYLVL